MPLRKILVLFNRRHCIVLRNTQNLQEVMSEIGLGLTVLSLVIWIGLLCFRGQFWRADGQLEAEGTRQQDESEALLPAICAVIPARNEAELLPRTLRSLLTQDYPSSFTVILVDDRSTDGTTQVAQTTALSLGKLQQLHVIYAKPLPPGWTGKVWAMEQGIQTAQTLSPDYILLSDADIEHDRANLRRLAAKAAAEDLDLVSVMVRLRCESFWEKLLIPAFVFFFQKLYPFRWVNNPTNTTAAAAGGCILIRRAALDRIGGMQAVRMALIDDCTLAGVVKSSSRGAEGAEGAGAALEAEGDALIQKPKSKIQNSLAPSLQPLAPQESPLTPHGKIWLGLSDLTRSLRPYSSLKSIWDMVARTAFTQLNYSPLLLVGTLVGMTLIYMVPPVAAVLGLVVGKEAIALVGLIAWLLMTLAYLPTIRFYNCSFWFAFCLPAIAFLYTLMTLDSAIRHWQGRGGAWKGRVYQG